MFKKISLLCALVLFTNIGYTKTYVASELFRFYREKNFPAVGTAKTVNTPMIFSKCKTTVKSILTSFDGALPTEVIVQTKILYLAKVWTNDGEMLFSCSKPDKQMTVVSSNYI